MRTNIITALAILVVLAICGIAMHMTALDNACTERGGQLEFSGNCAPKGASR